MKKSLMLAAMALAIAGCTKTVEEMNYSERKALADQIVQRCYAQGVKSGTKEMELCTAVEIQSESAKRRRQAAVEDAQLASGGPTVCNRVGYTVICN